MKDYIKKFPNATKANNYSIVDIPFMTTVVGVGTLSNLTCNQENKKIEVDEQGNISIVDAAKSVPTVSFKLITEEGSGNRFRVNGTRINVGSTVQWVEGDDVSIRLDYNGEKEIIQLITDSTGSVSFVFAGEDYEPGVEYENLGDNILQFTSTDAQGSDFPYNLIIAETETHSKLVIPCSVWCAD